MLLELRIENYAVIDNVVVEFGPGLNLLTGETGAGKSILVDALALLLGEKASSEVIRHGAERAVISGVFQVDAAGSDAVLEENGIDAEGGELILRRELAAGGKGRVFVNNQPATVGVLRKLAPLLGSIHSQKESMFAFAFDSGTRLRLLDHFAASDLAATAGAFRHWRQIRERIDQLQRDEQDRLRLLDLWSFQGKEIEAAHLQSGEDEALEKEKRTLQNAERLYSAATEAYGHLYEDNSSAAARMRLGMRQLEELARFDGRFHDAAAALDSARITVEDISSTLRDYAGSIDASPERLATLEDRLALVDRLKRKYGPTLEQVLALGQETLRKLSELENRDDTLKQLRRQLQEAATAYLGLARALSARRRQAARELESLTNSELLDLAMNARFKVKVESSAEPDDREWTPLGFDSVEYLISANPGEPLGAVEKIASGGELSRVMLALNTVARRSYAGTEAPAASAAKKSSPRANREGGKTPPATTLVFDEIDTGIGGRAAEAVGRKLKSLAQSSQVLCVTHLPQIAAFAARHFVIEKKEFSGRTRTTARPLSLQERADEIARMLSGATVTEVARKNAEQMLKASGTGNQL